jgi:hypothetical protein
MLSRLLLTLGRWQRAERAAHRVLGRLTTWPSDDFSRFTRTRLPGQDAAEGPPEARPPVGYPLQPPQPETIAPETFELRFARLQACGLYDDMWELLAEDAQRSWGSRALFAQAMRTRGQDLQVLGAEVDEVRIVPEWTDRFRRRTYRNVARLAVRYHVRYEHREWTAESEVHLVPAADGWRTLCYPESLPSRSS